MAINKIFLNHISTYIMNIIIIMAISLVFLSCGNKEINKQHSDTNMPDKTNQTVTKPAPALKYEILDKIPHDVTAYTQGLLFYDGYLYESTGQYGHSSIRKLNYKTGEILKNEKVPDSFFGEGISIFDKKIYMLTWQSRQCMIINLQSFKIENTFSYTGEGWGLTEDGTNLIMSDGSNLLKYIDPASRTVIKTVPVSYNTRPVSMLNELEYINGKIWANLYGEDRIAVIDPVTGNIENVIDFSELRNYEAENPFAEVLNGIAYNKTTGELYITGKNWKYYYNIKIN